MQASSSTRNSILVRSALVGFSALVSIVAVAVMIDTPFEEFSYLVGAVLLAGAVIMFGWSCYLGIAQRQTQQC